MKRPGLLGKLESLRKQAEQALVWSNRQCSSIASVSVLASRFLPLGSCLQVPALVSFTERRLRICKPNNPFLPQVAFGTVFYHSNIDISDLRHNRLLQKYVIISSVMKRLCLVIPSSPFKCLAERCLQRGAWVNWHEWTSIAVQQCLINTSPTSCVFLQVELMSKYLSSDKPKIKEMSVLVGNDCQPDTA